MSELFDLVVVGGGVVGLTAALAMVRRGFSVALVDAGTLSVNLTTPDPRVYAINQASEALLQELGVWQRLEQTRVSPYRHMYVWDAANGADIEFDARMVAAEHLGHIVEESVLKQALLEALNEEKDSLSLFPNQKVVAVESSTDKIRVDGDQKSWQGQLLMIADGANSPCRQLLTVALTSWSYHQQALVALVNTEHAHQHTAYQVFNSKGPLAFLPLIDQRQCSIVWSTTATHAEQLMALSDEEFNEHLTTAFASKLGQAKVVGKRYQFPLTMRHAKQYSGQRWLLLGDAAHTIHPLAGLGLNVGLADVATWLACLDENKNLLTSKKTLGSYQRQRKYAVWQIIAMMDVLKTLFTNPLPPVIALRGLGLGACNRLLPLKRMFIEQAAGRKLKFV